MDQIKENIGKANPSIYLKITLQNFELKKALNCSKLSTLLTGSG
jgi:hypothetical protein